MMTCPKCRSGLPEGLRFCLQCGASLAAAASAEAVRRSAEPTISDAQAVAPQMQEARVPPTPPVSPFRPARSPQATVNLKIAPTPVMSPRYEPLAANPRPSLGDNALEIDDESLKRSFERPVRHQPGAVICRFCKGPLDLGGDYCEHCGAPVAEAAPPGTVPIKPPAPDPPPPQLNEDPLASILGPAKAVAPASAPAGSPTGLHTSPAPLPPAQPAAQVEPQRAAPPHNPYLAPMPRAEENPSGLMGRLKGIFKKG
jgi:hypothetical protein